MFCFFFWPIQIQSHSCFMYGCFFLTQIVSFERFNASSLVRVHLCVPRVSAFFLLCFGIFHHRRQQCHIIIFWIPRLALLEWTYYYSGTVIFDFQIRALNLQYFAYSATLFAIISINATFWFLGFVHLKGKFKFTFFWKKKTKKHNTCVSNFSNISTQYRRCGPVRKIVLTYIFSF